MNKEIIKEFPVTVYGNLTPYSNTISKARCKIFYKYANRNGTYITDTFAKKLLDTIPYTPIKGIYKEEEGDYSDHGSKENVGNIYGIVPENPNLQWEKHIDEDGYERTYACVDVLLFSALYKEAGEIVGKPQSMEIYGPSIKGSWKEIKGQRMYEYTDGCFLGLQVLGEEIEPCFEGAAFFELYSSLKGLIDELKEYNIKIPNINKGGQLIMPEINFKLSDAQKHEAIWKFLNKDYSEEGGWVVEYGLCDVYDDYALVYNYDQASYEKVYYTKDDKADEVTITDRETVFVVFVTETEKGALDTIRTLNGNTFEKVDEVYNSVEELKEENSTYEQKITELGSEITTLNSEKEQFTTQNEETSLKISGLIEEIEVLNSYKENIETQEKEFIVDSYAELLTEEILKEYKEKLSDYSAIELDKELAYELKQLNVSVFTKNTSPQMLPKDEPKGGLEEILSKYRK